ncbi:MAG: hypothetical protein IJ545_00350 [Alphaproteobacteria bacterium]|nr:hypothetical protein [Alphaproteobacteria bacterium]
MTKFFYIFIFCFIGFASLVTAKDVKFIDGLEDIPLMSGLEQNTQNTVSFGNEEARFIEVYLTSSKVGFKAVEKFYTESLPQLGWIYQGTDDNSVIFYRDGESLTFHKDASKPLKIRITVKNRI